MNLQIRDPKAHALARELAERRKTSMTEAVIAALEAELRRESERRPLAERAKALATELRSRSKGAGRDMGKDEIDEMWGNA
jgi:antitoxin VapB